MFYTCSFNRPKKGLLTIIESKHNRIRPHIKSLKDENRIRVPNHHPLKPDSIAARSSLERLMIAPGD
ncbi:hypothetical protein SCG7109_AN_00010 [Chlamydiales bacterium SCGC AG-110-M15]|nr:hypothetical protein SCG7109_AN_00010 [Chlamydiales bacterium SCGC AG-110-M15]